MSDNGQPTSPSQDLLKTTGEGVPRWEATITPVGNGEGHLNLIVHAEGVSTIEIAHVLCKLVAMFTSQVSVLPTEAQVAAQRAATALAKEHPAQRIFVRAGQQKWLGAAVPSSIVTQLVAAGWVDAGAVPEDVVRGCDYTRDPNAFTAAINTEDEAPEVDA